jgi:hypothetical protein
MDFLSMRHEDKNADVIASPLSDFLIDDMTFEIGGKNKGQKQIRKIEKSFVAKDDLELGYGNVIPSIDIFDVPIVEHFNHLVVHNGISKQPWATYPVCPKAHKPVKNRNPVVGN